MGDLAIYENISWFDLLKLGSEFKTHQAQKTQVCSLTGNGISMDFFSGCCVEDQTSETRANIVKTQKTRKCGMI